MNQTEDAAVVIFGCGNRLSQGLAQAYAQKGKTVILCDSDVVLLDQVAADLLKLGASIDTMPVDIGDRQSVEAVRDRIIAREGHVDVVANAACPPRFNDPHDWDGALRQNLMGAVHVVESFLAPIKERSGRFLQALPVQVFEPAGSEPASVGSFAATLGAAEAWAGELAKHGASLTTLFCLPDDLAEASDKATAEEEPSLGLAAAHALEGRARFAFCTPDPEPVIDAYFEPIFAAFDRASADPTLRAGLADRQDHKRLLKIYGENP